MFVHRRGKDCVDEIVEGAIGERCGGRSFAVDAYLSLSGREDQLDISTIFRIGEEPRDGFVHRQSEILELVDIEAGFCAYGRRIESTHFQVTGSGGKPNRELIDLQDGIQSAPEGECWSL